MFLRLLSALFFLLGCISQRQSKSNFIPPGTVKITDTLFIDETEVSNIHWREYLSYLLDVNKDTIGYQIALPDTLVWNNLEWKPDTVFKEIILLNNPYTEYYLRHPAFNNYPVVGVSHEQAIEFCKWRTLVANQTIYFKEKNITDWKMHLKDKFPIRFIYRLPTKGEWERIASSGIDSTNKVFKKYNKRSVISHNTKERINAIKQYSQHNPFTTRNLVTPAKSFYVSKSGTYNMIGNIGEMISEKGIAKGGSFNHQLDSCRFIFDQYFSKPENWLGFRCVAVLLK